MSAPETLKRLIFFLAVASNSQLSDEQARSLTSCPTSIASHRSSSYDVFSMGKCKCASASAGLIISCRNLNAAQFTTMLNMIGHDTIQRLIIRDSNLKGIRHNFLHTFINLDTIELQNCALSISEVACESLRGLTKLRRVDLSHNKLSYLCEEFFLNSKSENELRVNLEDCGLKNVRLMFNKAAQVDGNDIKMKYSIIDLSDNPIQNFDTSAFEGLVELTELDLSNVGLQEFPSTIFGIQPPTELYKLNLARNNMQSIGAGTFDILQDSLKNLNLAHNEIFSVGNEAFAKLVNLNSLDLSHNTLTRFNDKSLAGLEKLRSLSIASNPLQTITKSLFKDLKSLSFLSLAGLRNIQTISDNLLEENDKVDVIDFSKTKLPQARKQAILQQAGAIQGEVNMEMKVQA